jgi:hypothetical protein
MKKALRLTAFLAFIFCSITGFAQTDDAAVRDVVNRLFEGMKKSDTAMIRSCFAPGGLLQSVATSREGKTILETEPLDSFLAIIARPHTQLYDERIRFDDVKIDGPLAMVWAPYQFYLGDKFSHCGVDVFQLMKSADGWKIIYLVDTRRRQNCL